MRNTLALSLAVLLSAACAGRQPSPLYEPPVAAASAVEASDAADVAPCLLWDAALGWSATAERCDMVSVTRDTDGSVMSAWRTDADRTPADAVAYLAGLAPERYADATDLFPAIGGPRVFAFAAVAWVGEGDGVKPPSVYDVETYAAFEMGGSVYVAAGYWHGFPVRDDLGTFAEFVDSLEEK